MLCIPAKLATHVIEYDYNNCWIVNYVNVSQGPFFGRVWDQWFLV